MRIFQKTHRGFTLIEIMVVVIVLSVLAAVIIPNFASQPDKARISKAKTDISSMCTLLENFRLDMGRYPTEEEGLDVLRKRPNANDADRWKGPYAKNEIPKDPWGKPYHYYNPCPNGIDGFGIESLGSDGQPGGGKASADAQSGGSQDDDPTADIRSWSEDAQGEGSESGGPPSGNTPGPGAPSSDSRRP